MPRYVGVSMFGLRKRFEFETDDMLKLRRRCREALGLRRSTKMIYKRIGTNSFRVENKWGWSVMDVYLAT